MVKTPLVPLSNSYFHTTTQLRFTFTSDAINNDIGYWIDELVIIYDQVAKKKEFQIETSGVSVIEVYLVIGLQLVLR